jgi:TPR repeat protein
MPDVANDVGAKQQLGSRPAISPRAAVISAFLIAFVPPVGALLFLPAKWLLLQFSQFVGFVSLIAGGFLVFAVGSQMFAYFAQGSGGQDSAAESRSQNRRVRRWCIVAALAGLAVGGELAVDFAAGEIKDHLKEALPGAEQLYVNHDVAKLVGETLAVMTLKARAEEPDPAAKRSLSAIAKVLPDEWVKLTNANDPRVAPLTEQELWMVVQNPRHGALDDNRWAELVDEWAKAARVAPLAPESRKKLAKSFTTTFSFAWREALKHDYTHNGKASEAMHLDLFGALLRRTSENADTSDPETKAALVKLSDVPDVLAQLAQRVQSQSDEHSRRVAREFNGLKNHLLAIHADVVAVREGVVSIKEDTAEINEGLRKSAGDIEEVKNLIRQINVASRSSAIDEATALADAAIKADFRDYEAQLTRGRSLPYFTENSPLRFRAWLKEAERGNAMAQVLVGRALAEGAGVEQDRAKALAWFERAASQENASGLFNLALFYEDGEGGAPADAVSAARLLKKAADRGNSRAMAELGRFYVFGLGGLPADKKLGLSWYERAIEKGDSLAMRLAAELYNTGGSGVPVDKAKAEQLFKRASRSGNDVAEGVLVARSIEEAVAAYLAAGVNADAKSRAVEQARSALVSLESLGIEAILWVATDFRVVTAVAQSKALGQADAMRAELDKLAEMAIARFRASDQATRTSMIGDFARATEGTVTGWHLAGQHDRVVALWKDCYRGIKIANRTDGEQDRLVQQLRACAVSLCALGYRDEAIKQIDEAFALCDAILAMRAWDFYLRDAAKGLGWSAGAALAELGDEKKSQQYLRRAWKLQFEMDGREDLMNHFVTLPLKGELPKDGSAEDRAYFDKFRPGAKSSKLTRFMVPANFAGTKYPFAVYIPSGKHGYAELQDQFIWLKEYRGGVVEKEVEESFRKVNKIAIDNNVDFRELCVYALGASKKEEATASSADVSSNGIQIQGTPSFVLNDVTAALDAAEAALAGLVTGRLVDGKEVARAKGFSYVVMCDLAQKWVFAQAGRPDQESSMVREKVAEFYKRTLGDAKTRDEVAEITSKWLGFAKRPNGGVFFAGKLAHVQRGDVVTECGVELSDGRLVAVILPAAAGRTTANVTSLVGVIGWIAERPTEQVVGYKGKATQAVFTRKLIPLE